MLDAPPAFSLSVNLASLCDIMTSNFYFSFKLDDKIIQEKEPSFLRINFNKLSCSHKDE